MSQNEPISTSRNVYPSFYVAAHRAWNRIASTYRVQVETSVGSKRSPQYDGIAELPICTGAEEPFEPDQHGFCFDLAQSMRVEQHAIGIRLSIDGNGSYVDPLKPARRRIQRRRIGPDPEDVVFDMAAGIDESSYPDGTPGGSDSTGHGRIVGAARRLLGKE